MSSLFLPRSAVAARWLPCGRSPVPAAAAVHSLCQQHRHHQQRRHPADQRRSIVMVDQPQADPPLDVDALRATLAARPPTATYDVLSPTHSHLLNVSLSDYLPAGAGAVEFDRQSAASATTTATAAKTNPFVLPSAASAGLLPPGPHLVYFPLQKPPSLLLPDGTDPTQSPGAPFVRRMWAGGSVRFLAPENLLLDNRRAVCVERLGPDIRVTGTPGAEKVFVNVWRRYGPVPDLGARGAVSPEAIAGVEAAVEADPAIEELRTLVFLRDSPRAAKNDAEAAKETQEPERKGIQAAYPPDASFSLTPPPSLLFHFSALSFNAHAIHLDPQFCREQEGHRGRLVHGPLSLVLLLAAVRKQVAKVVGTSPAEVTNSIQSIEYRNLAPLYAGEPLRVCIRQNHNGHRDQAAGARWDVWIEGPQGGVSVRGVAVTNSG
ncbi:hypothetical protein SPI_02830 [Niveomyces insectorum RCEF 264]|uniref:Uncharacterized protein n=1 Tax=Niveomyces insectorum RCEF 264 TaxID=1081102 RepID=A0A162K279_9HYPO|nr:hypothetical protein SPI_02830 [Niveomyces insectorum RCEF 264]